MMGHCLSQATGVAGTTIFFCNPT